MWAKKGLIFNVDGSADWNKSHAQVPVADVLPDKIRIYYATRNTEGKSNVGFIDVAKDDPEKIIFKSEKPLLDLGDPGTFDDCGIMPSCIINVGKRKFLYYIGWTTRQTVPFQNAVGLAISDDAGATFSKVSKGPVISTNHKEPYFSGTSFVMQQGNSFKMWYLSCVRWEMLDGRMEPLYDIKYAESSNGIDWDQAGKVAIALNNEEGGLASAAVIIEQGLYKMWFGRRGKSGYRDNSANSYRIGYAESVDGVQWQRKDDRAGIDVSAEGWDSQMISYPYVFRNGNVLTMLYNGNGFGQTGFGYAVWE